MPPARARLTSGMDAPRLVGIAVKEKTRAPMVEHETLAATLRGLVGERSHPKDRSVTVLAQADWRAACDQLGESLPWTLRRANLLVAGLALAASVGRRLRVGRVLLEVTEDNPPCRVMDILHAGAWWRRRSRWERWFPGKRGAEGSGAGRLISSGVRRTRSGPDGVVDGRARVRRRRPVTSGRRPGVRRPCGR